MSTPNPVKWFDSLSQADFRNGAIRDEIREYISDWVAFDKRIAALKRQLAEVTKERDAANQHIIVVRESRDMLHDERDFLRAALHQVAEALNEVQAYLLFHFEQSLPSVDDALALPEVRSIWKGGEHESGL